MNLQFPHRLMSIFFSQTFSSFNCVHFMCAFVDFNLTKLLARTDLICDLKMVSNEMRPPHIK